MKALKAWIVYVDNWLTGLVECSRLVILMESMLYGSKAKNFMTACVTSTSGERFEITLRRADGKTPGERIAELELEVERLKRLLALAAAGEKDTA